MSDGAPHISELSDEPPAPRADQLSEPASGIQGFAGGTLQGAVFDPVQGIGQLIEHATGHDIPIPQGVQDWFDSYKAKYTSGMAGKAGRVVGTVGSLFVPMGAAAKAAGWAGRLSDAQVGARGLQAVGKALSSPRQIALEKVAERTSQSARGAGKSTKAALAAQKQIEASRTLGSKAAESASEFTKSLPNFAKGAAIGGGAAALQPVGEGEDFAKTKREQMAAGALGGALGAPAAAIGVGGAAAAGAAKAADEVFKTFGWPGAIALMSSLGMIAARYNHQLWGGALKAGRSAAKIGGAPLSQYATGRAAGAGANMYEENQ